MRSTAFRAQPPPIVAKRMETALTSRMCMVQEVGPTCFVVRPLSGSEPSANGEADAAAPQPAPERPDATFKVRVGSEQTCTCGDRELCVHILFVMLKVFRLDVGNPLVWQKSLVDAEITKILSDRERSLHAASLRTAAAPAAAPEKRCAQCRAFSLVTALATLSLIPASIVLGG